MDKVLERFYKYIHHAQNDCWEWTGARDKDGYGFFYFNKLMHAHRASYILFKSSIPQGYQIDHLCRNRPCVNPAHLEAVTSKVNTMRSPIAPAALNAKKTHCYKGHALTGDNLIYVRTTGERRCRICTIYNKKIHRAKLRQKRIDAGEVITFGPKRSEKCLYGHNKEETASGKWYCRTCARLKTARYRQRKKSALI